MDEDGKKTEGHTPWPKLRFITEDDEANATIVPVDDGWKPWFTMHAVGPCGVEDRLCAAVVDAMNERSALLRCEEALRAHAEWFGKEGEGPVYPAGTSRDSEGGEAIWRAWWDEQLELCRRATDLTRAALTLLDEVRK